MSGSPRDRRARLALVACVLWLAGFEVLPWLHVAFHDELAPHVHTADGAIIRVSFDGEVTHRHADGTIHRGRDDRGARARHRRGDAPGYALDHGADSLAHHGVAAVPAPIPLHAPLPVAQRPVVVALATAAEPAMAMRVCAVARGPPVATFTGV